MTRNPEEAQWAIPRDELLVRLMALTDALEDIVVMEDTEPRVVFVNPAARAFYAEVGIAEPVGMHCCDVVRQLAPHVRSDSDEAVVEAVYGIVTSREVVTGMPLEMRDGRIYELEHRPVHERDGTFLGHLWRLRNVTEERRHQRDVERHSALYRARSEFNRAIIHEEDAQSLLDRLVRIVVEHAELKIAWVGRVQADGRLFPVAAAGLDREYLREHLHITTDPSRPEGRGPSGRAVQGWVPMVVNDIPGEPSAAPWRELAEAHGVLASGTFPIGERPREPVGALCLSVYASEMAFFEAPVIGLLMELAADAGHALAQLERDRAYAEARNRLHRQIYFDDVSGLPNRHALHEALEQGLAEALRDGHYGALVYVDLDRFKRVNDSLGHGIGDRLLRTVGQRLRRGFGREALVAHLSADEFVLLLPNLGADPDAARARAMELAARVQRNIDRRHRVRGHPVDIQSSIGVAWFPADDDANSNEGVITRADMAMYHAKAEGGGVRPFEQRMFSHTRRRLSLEHELRRALERDGFELFLQPQHRLADDRFAGAEALLRWESPGHGPVSPAEFVPLAEEAGLIVGLGDWVLDSTLAVIRRWLDAGLAIPEHGFAVNVSPHQFHLDDFVERVKRGLQHHRVPPEMLMLEITESAVVDNIGDTVTKMHALREEGVGFAMDDFGTGYSSLTHIHQLPLDTLKIDRAFITGIHETPRSAAVVDTILNLARSMELYVVAEGVEEAGERDHLLQRDCDTYQGFLRARPMDIDSLFAHARATGGGAKPD